MSSPSNLLQDLAPRKLLIVRALVVGDMLCTIPALRALRTALPDTHVTLCSLPWAASLTRRYPRYIDSFLEFPGFPGLPERPFDPFRFTQFLIDVQSRRFDLALQLHGSGSYINPFLMLLNARQTAGFCSVGDYAADPRWYLEYPEKGHEVERLLALCHHLGAPAQGNHLEFPLLDDDFVEWNRIRDTYQLDPGSFICLHAGARFASRRWLPEHFASVGDRLARLGYSIVLTGTESERSLVEQVAFQMRATPILLVGSTSLGGAAAVVSHARLIVTNDTGMSHLAVAVNTPSVVLVLGSDRGRWAPLDAVRHPSHSVDVPCRPCMHATCPIHFPCATGLTPEDVFATCERLLKVPYCRPVEDEYERQARTSVTTALAQTQQVPCV